MRAALALKEQGRERSEFLRAVCTDEPRSRRPSARERQLLRAHGDRWVEFSLGSVEFRRGFPECVELSACEYLCHEHTLERVAPTLAVGLTSFEPEDEFHEDWEEEEKARFEIVDRLARCPSLERWLELQFLACPGGEVFEALLSSPHLTRLRRLIAVSNECGGAVAVVNHQRFSDLRWLDLYNSDSAGGEPGDDVFVDLVTSPHLARLEHLDYGANDCGDEGLAALAGSPTTSRLRSLGLHVNYATSAGWRALARSAELPALGHLDLSSSFGQPPDDGALAALLESPLFARLTFLDVASNAIGDEGVARLARTPAAAGLRALVLGGAGAWCPRTCQRRPVFLGPGILALANSPHLGGLRRLVLSGVPLDDGTALALARSRGLKRLRQLVVEAGPGLGDAGLLALRERFGAGLSLPS